MGWREMIGLGEASVAGGTDSQPVEQPPPDPPFSEESERWRNVNVVGESHYQAALWKATGLENTGARVDCECIAELIPEPENPHDPRAVMVCVGGECVGYLTRGLARRYGKRIREMRAASQPTICDAFIGGLLEDSDNPNLGITLKFPVTEDGDYVIEAGAAEIARRVLAERGVE
jgi:hypothetical protein